MKQNKTIKRTLRSAAYLTCGATALLVGTAAAQSVDKNRFDISSGALGEALDLYIDQSGEQLLYSADHVEGLSTDGVRGVLSNDEALEDLLSGSNLKVRQDPSGAVLITASVDRAVRSTMAQQRPFRVAQAASPAIANDGAPISGASYADETIIVTATRRDERLQDVPLAVTALDPDLFEAIGQTSVRNIIDFVPGFQTQNPAGGPPGRGDILARGAATIGSGAAVVGVYLDDVPVGSNLSNVGQEVYLDGTLFDLERIEFLAGPQGTLYGASSIGGAVRYVTSKPSLTEFGGKASVNLSGTDEGGFNAIYSGHVGGPLIEDRVGLKVSGFFDDNAGLIDAVDPFTGVLIEEDADRYESYGYDADLLLSPTDRLDVRLRYLKQKTDGGARNGGAVLVDANLAPVFGEYETIRNPEDTEVSETDLFSGTITFDLDWATLTSISAYTESSYVGLSETVTLNLAADFLFGLPFGTTEFVESKFDVDTERFVQEIRLTSAPKSEAGEFEWLFGLYYADESSDVVSSLVAFPGTRVATSQLLENSYEEYAAFGNLTYYITDKLDVTVGARVSRQTPELTAVTTGPLNGESDFRTDTGSTADTYMANIRYRPNDDLSLYGRVASGFRPARTQVPILDNGVNIAPEKIESDDLWSYEVGAKGVLGDGVASFDVALFHVDWDNFQSLLTTPLAIFFGNASDGITINGVEGSLGLEPLDGLSILSTVSFTESTLNSDEPEVFGLEGQQTPRIPKWTAAMNARYDFALTGDLDAHVGGTVRYQDEERSAFDDGNPSNGQVNLITGDYVLADLNAGLSAGPLALDLYVTNLFNEYEFVGANGLTTSLNGNPVRPRTVGAVVSFEF